MNTLLEFITFTKATEYLIAIAFLFGFIAFWQLMHSKGRGLAKKIVPPTVLALGVGALAALLISSQAMTTADTPSAVEVPLLSSEVLVEMYGPAAFDHEMHQTLADDCFACHHNSEDRTPPCKECHDTPFDPEDLAKPGLTHVFHLHCISCHKENHLGPTDCTGCHPEEAVPPLSIAHSVTGVEDCLSCHGAETARIPGCPADHADATNGVCQLCHKVAVEPIQLATRKTPHEVAGKENCLLCHEEGITGAAKAPADHEGATNDTCLLCHQPLIEELPTPTDVPAESPSSDVPTPAVEPTPQVVDDTTCIACHTDEETLRAVAQEEEQVETISEGEG